MGYFMKTLSGSGESFFILNKIIVIKYGVNVALMLTALAEGEQVTSDGTGWFYQTSDTIKKFTGLSRSKQDKAIKKLIELGIIEKRIVGVPAKRYFKLNEENFMKVLKDLSLSKNDSEFVNN